MAKTQVPINYIYLRHLSLQEAKQKLLQALTRAYQNGQLINVIIHGQGHESAHAPVIKQFVRSFLETSDFARQYVYDFHFGETGSRWTGINPGETVVVVKAVRGDTAARLAALEHDSRRTSRRGEKNHEDDYEYEDDYEEEHDPLLAQSKYDGYEEALEERESRRKRRSLKAGRSHQKSFRDW